MTRLHASRKVIAILGIAVAVAVAVCFLPENPYQRWKLLKGTFQEHAIWIYERIHFDPRPIDVAFIGPSRTERGVEAMRLQAELARLGTRANVVNFALPQGGRDVNDVIVQELLAAKRPKLLVIGVIEKPSRLGHPAFKYIAPRGMVANPGYLSNVHYLQNLIYLPYRQMQLFAADVAPSLAGMPKEFDPSTYEPNQIPPKVIRIFDDSMHDANRPGTTEELQSGVHTLEAGTRPPILPPALAAIEFGDEQYYLHRIVASARKKGVKVAFLFIPYYTGPSQVLEESFYRQFGPVWNAGFIAPHAELFSDYAHLTTNGADRLTDWTAPLVADALTTPETKR